MIKKISHSQHNAWEKEYQNPLLLSLSSEPQHDMLRVVQWLKKDAVDDYQIQAFHRLTKDPKSRALDLGCGNGRNLVFLAREYGIHGIGYDVAPTAIQQARKIAQEAGVGAQVTFSLQDIAEPYTPIADASIDFVIDMTASSSLYAGERSLYLREVARVLAPEGIFFVRTLCLDGDRNAKNLLQNFPGPEEHTYMLPELGLMERVFTEKEFRDTYGDFFDILFLKKQTGYQRWGNQSYKRRYAIAYMTKKKKEHNG